MFEKKIINPDLQWIQALRGIAALMVLFFHMHPHWDLIPTLSMTTAVTRWGFSGVDIFFVLSGFVVFRSARRTIPARGFRPFIKKRLLRIYLGYWPVLLLIALVTMFVYQESLPPIKKMLLSTLLLYPNIWDNWLPPAWSLSMEIYFYLWIGLIVLLPLRYQIKAAACIIVFLAIWGIGWLATNQEGVYNGLQPLRYVFTGLGIEFLGGALIAHVYDKQALIFERPRLTLPLCIALICAGFSLGMTSPYFDRVEVMRVASFGMIGMSALVLVLTLEQTKLTPPTWLVAVGNASYSIYLLHTFLLDASGRIRVENGITSPAALLTFLLCLPLIIVLISLLWYRLIEKPIMKTAL